MMPHSIVDDMRFKVCMAANAANMLTCIQVSVVGCGVGGSSSMSSPSLGLLGLPLGLGGRGCMSLGTITKSLPSTRIAPAGQ